MPPAFTDRRSFVVSMTGLGAAAGFSGAAALAGALAGAPPPSAPSGEKPVPLEAMGRVPWPYLPLDPEAVAEAAFRVYQKGLCMRAVFEPLVGAVAARLGPPFTALPFGMFGYGAGGVSGWGTLCGTLNGGAAAFALLSPNPAPLISALFAWYESESLPDVVVPGGRFETARAVAGSVLCHASVAKWCAVSGKTIGSPERFERCGVLAACVARKATLLLNAQSAGTRISAPLDKTSASCLTCHGSHGSKSRANGRMRCAPCHTGEELRALNHEAT